jgi:hypothetical protein
MLSSARFNRRQYLTIECLLQRIKLLYIYTGHFISEFSHRINSCIYFSVKLSMQYMKPGIYYVIYNVHKSNFFEILTFHNALKSMISQLSWLTLTFSKSHRNILFSNVPIINFIMFFDICEAYTYTLYERYPPHKTSAQILHREITDYDLEARKYHLTLF